MAKPSAIKESEDENANSAVPLVPKCPDCQWPVCGDKDCLQSFNRMHKETGECQLLSKCVLKPKFKENGASQVLGMGEGLEFKCSQNAKSFKHHKCTLFEFFKTSKVNCVTGKPHI